MLNINGKKRNRVRLKERKTGRILLSHKHNPYRIGT